MFWQACIGQELSVDFYGSVRILKFLPSTFNNFAKKLKAYWNKTFLKPLYRQFFQFKSGSVT